MKKLALAAAISAFATASFAGGGTAKYDEPVIEPVVIEEDTRKGAAGIVVPILLLAVIAAAVAAR